MNIPLGTAEEEHETATLYLKHLRACRASRNELLRACQVAAEYIGTLRIDDKVRPDVYRQLRRVLDKPEQS